MLAGPDQAILAGGGAARETREETMKVWHPIVLALVGVLAGCGSSSSVSCGDGIFCPAKTSCSADGICLVETDSCPDFQPNSACLDSNGQTGFCGVATCEPSVVITGVIGDDFGGGDQRGLEGAEVSIIDQPWVKPIITANLGVFELNVRPGDQVTISATATDRMQMRTRQFAIGDELFEINENSEDAVAVVTLPKVDTLYGQIEATRSPDEGLVIFGIKKRACPDGEGGMQPCAVANIRASLAGSSSPAFYFDGANVQPGIDRSTADTTAVAFMGVPPGSYELVVEHPLADCFGMGLDRPTNIEVEVVADTMTNLAVIACTRLSSTATKSERSSQ